MLDNAGTMRRMEELSDDQITIQGVPMPLAEARDVAASKHTSGKVLAAIAWAGNTELNRVVARNRVTPPRVLRVLAASTDDATLLNVASNRNTPPDVLAGMLPFSSNRTPSQRPINDGRYKIKARLAANPNTPPGTLMRLAEEPEQIRKPLINNPSVPEEVLLLLGKDINPKSVFGFTVRQKLAARHKAAIAALTDPDVAAIATQLQPAWTGSTADLLAAAVGIHAPIAGRVPAATV